MSREQRRAYLLVVVLLAMLNATLAVLLAGRVAHSGACVSCPPIACAAGDDGTCPGGCHCVAHGGVGQCEAR